jgi:hypothetical protein
MFHHATFLSAADAGGKRVRDGVGRALAPSQIIVPNSGSPVSRSDFTQTRD